MTFTLFQQFIQVFAVSSLYWRLAQVIATSRKSVMKLVVQIEAICQHKQGRTQQILQKLMGIEYH